MRAPTCLLSATSISAPHLNAAFQQDTSPPANQLQLASFHLFPIVVSDCAALVDRLGRAFKAVPPGAPPLYNVFFYHGLDFREMGLCENILIILFIVFIFNNNNAFHVGILSPNVARSLLVSKQRFCHRRDLALCFSGMTPYSNTM